MNLFQKKRNSGTLLTVSVVKIGSGAREFLAEKMLIFFGSKAPDYLAEHCFILDDTSGDYAVCTGDVLAIGGSRYKITAIGDVALQNFKALGHLVVVFDGAAAPSQPGTLHVEAKKMPKIEVGTVVSLEKA